MKKSKFTETQIIAIIKEADAGMKVEALCRQYSISSATYYNWKKNYGGMDASELKQCYLDVSFCKNGSSIHDENAPRIFLY